MRPSSAARDSGFVISMAPIRYRIGWERSPSDQANFAFRWGCPSWVDAVEKVPKATFLPKDETRDDCPSICPQASCRSHRRVRRLMMLPPTQLRDGRTYGSENLRSAMQKDFFDSIGPKPPIRDVRFTAVIRGIAEVTLTSQNRRN